MKSNYKSLTVTFIKHAFHWPLFPAAPAMAVDTSQLRSSLYTTFHQSFYLLRVPLTIGGQPAQIISNDEHLTIGCRYPAVSITFDSLTTEVDTTVKSMA